MGRIARQVSPNTTRYYWYPGDRKDWLRALMAGAGGLVTFILVWFISHSLLASVVLGASVATGVGGLNLGRRDARALDGFPEIGTRAARRAAVAVTGRASWRALVEGAGGASAAVLIVHLPTHGVAATWLLPLVPSIVGALAHQAGMLSDRLAHQSAKASSLRGVLKPELGSWGGGNRPEQLQGLR